MALLVNKLKYKKRIIVGLLIIALGCLIFIPARITLIYKGFLFGLFILATGVVVLQVLANPLIIAGLMILVALFISRFNFNSVNDPLQKEAARGH
ncbi:hypothetical protein [Candidatus Coxiella mudrowiae]|uniref:hypothetical protein n=1 Tax=Candidatus Coxiella mudrowiae TaxID=2054173 RepID=UPI0012FEAE50|nr:hypothetical protein [Candidatus Coxiella mudrowiae]